MREEMTRRKAKYAAWVAGAHMDQHGRVGFGYQVKRSSFLVHYTHLTSREQESKHSTCPQLSFVTLGQGKEKP